MTLSFLHPEALWLTLILPLVLWWMRARVRLAHRLIRAGIFLLLILALSQPALVRATGAAPQAVVVDQSQRLSPQARAEAATALTELVARSRGPVHVVQRGGSRLDVRTAGYDILPEPGEGASLTRALERAAQTLPLGPEGRLTVISDGLGADQDWGRAVAGLLRRGVPVDTVSLSASRREAFIADVVVPQARPGEQAVIDVRVEGVGEGMAIEVRSGDRVLGRSDVFAVDGETLVSLPIPLETPGFTPLQVDLTVGQTRRDRFATAAAVQDPVRWAYVSGSRTDGGAALQRILGRGYRIDAVGAGALASQAGRDAWRGVILDDVPASALPAPVQTGLVSAVRDRGLGLFVSGGDGAFAAGGYAGSPLAAALPVSIRQQEMTRDPSVALAVVIDTSGSMLGTPLDLARQMARLAVRKLGPEDSVGVVEFYGGRQWVAPMQPARDIPEVERAISRVQAQGGSELLFAALQEAYYGLQTTEARYRHILVISDAGVNADRYPQLIRHMTQNNVVLSTVLVGGSPQGEIRMAEWARLGRGRFYIVRDEYGLVQVDLKQPQQQPEPGLQRGRVALVAGATPFGWSDVVRAPVPALDGVALAGDRPRADTLFRTPGGDPVLASWQYGAGRVTALMSEPVGPASAGWRAWPGYGDWLSRILAQTAEPRPEFQVDLVRDGHRLTVRAQRTGGIAGAAPEIRVVGADGRRTVLPAADERAPGLFTTVASLNAALPAQVEVEGASGTVRASSGGTAGRPPSQARALPLERLSRETGGVHAAAGRPLPAPAEGRGALSAFDLWSWLCWMALAAYVGELLYRRWPPRLRLRGVNP